MHWYDQHDQHDQHSVFVPLLDQLHCTIIDDRLYSILYSAMVPKMFFMLCFMSTLSSFYQVMLKTAASSLRDSIVQVVFQSPAGLLSFVSCKKSTFNHVDWRRVKVLLASIKKRDWAKKERAESFLKCGESISARECFPSGWIVGYIGFLPKLPPISSKLRIRTDFLLRNCRHLDDRLQI